VFQFFSCFFSKNHSRRRYLTLLFCCRLFWFRLFLKEPGNQLSINLAPFRVPGGGVRTNQLSICSFPSKSWQEEVSSLPPPPAWAPDIPSFFSYTCPPFFTLATLRAPFPCPKHFFSPNEHRDGRYCLYSRLMYAEARSQRALFPMVMGVWPPAPFFSLAWILLLFPLSGYKKETLSLVSFSRPLPAAELNPPP